MAFRGTPGLIIDLIRNSGSVGQWGCGLGFLASFFAGTRQRLGMGTEGALCPSRPRASTSGQHNGASCHRC